ncbi:MAG: response regulator [Pirellulales bacterium]
MQVAVPASQTRHCVAIVDDDALVAKAIAASLTGPEFDVRVFATGGEFQAAVEELNLCSGCTLVDLRLAAEYGMQLIQALSGNTAAVHRPNIVISGYADVSNTLEAMKLGCWTVLQKPIDMELLRRTVQEACAWSSENRGRLARETEIFRLWGTINEKERSTIDMILEGLPNKSVASRLGVSVRTVENRRRQILAKLGINSVAQLGRIVALIDAVAMHSPGVRRFALYSDDGRTRNAGSQTPHSGALRPAWHPPTLGEGSTGRMR